MTTITQIANFIKTHYIIILIILIVIAFIMRNKLPSDTKKQTDEQNGKFINQYGSVKSHSTEVDEDSNDNINDTSNDDNGTKPKLVMYHSNHCGHCRDFMSVWQKFVHYIEENRKDIDVSDVECLTNQKQCGDAHVNAVPTVLLYINDKPPITFDGDRTVDELKKFVTDFCG
jgi:thioredoxin-like negative regulator of GroEL